MLHNVQSSKQQQYTKKKRQDDFQEITDTYMAYDKWNLDELPILKHKREILYAVDNFSTVILVAETGSGKTTKVPQFLFEAGYSLNGKQIAVTQPRRIAAVSVGQRVAQEMGVPLGSEVGYSVRFDQKHSEQTGIKYLTDGMLINEILSDPLLQKYSVLMVDDIHERTINTDLILGLIKKIRKKRPDLKIIISSATLDALQIKKFFQEPNFTSQILYIQGRQYDVDLFYLNYSCKNYVLKAVDVSIQIHKEKPLGDILVFLTSQEEIEVFIQIFQNILQSEYRDDFILLPLYANLPLNDQMEVFKPQDQRKIIVSTNIAESSITIDNIVYVVDSMFHKIKYYDYKKGFDELISVPISKSSADQRKGRAGRVRKGECYRLTTKDDYQALYQNSTPEIIRGQLNDFVLSLKQLGVANILKFDLMDRPSDEAIYKSLEYLSSMGIIDEQCNLTESGEKVCEFSVESKIALMIMKSFDEEFQCSKEILILAAMLSIQGSLFFTNEEPPTIINRKKKIGAKEGDHITLINIFIKYSSLKKESRRQFCFEHKISDRGMQQASKIHEYLQKQVKHMKLKIQSSEDNIESILRCIVSGFFVNIAQRQPNGYYRNVRNNELLQLHPQSILTINPPLWVTYYEVVKTNSIYMREVTEIDQKWILELAPHFYEDNRQKLATQKHENQIKEQLVQEELKKKEKQAQQLEQHQSLFIKKKKNDPKSLKRGKLSFIKDKSQQNQNNNNNNDEFDDITANIGQKKKKKVKLNMLSFGDDNDM